MELNQRMLEKEVDVNARNALVYYGAVLAQVQELM